VVAVTARVARAAAALVVPALCAACGIDLTPPAEWTPWEAIDPPLQPELGAPPLEPASSQRAVSIDPLRVVTYNVATGVTLDEVGEALAADPELATAGLLLLQELESYPGEGASRAAILAERLGLAYAYIPSREKKDGTHGLAILSAFPIDGLAVMVLPDAGVPLTGAVRIAARADVHIEGRVVAIVDLHLDTSLNIGERMVELRPAVIDQPDAVIVAGDFNTNDFIWADGAVPLTPVASAVDTEQAPMIDEFMARLGYQAPTAGFGPTESHLGVESRLDSIYVRGYPTGAGGVVRSVDASDHWPVWLDVELP
jgi:endonuclease/exonuclease/phosphatase family metal-dependent hydrolase